MAVVPVCWAQAIPGPTLQDCSALDSVGSATTMPAQAQQPCAVYLGGLTRLGSPERNNGGIRARSLRVGGSYGSVFGVTTGEADILVTDWDSNGRFQSSFWITPADRPGLWLPPMDSYGDSKGRTLLLTGDVPGGSTFMAVGGLYSAALKCPPSGALFYSQARCAANCSVPCTGAAWQCPGNFSWFLDSAACNATCSVSCVPALSDRRDFSRDVFLFDAEKSTWTQTVPLNVGTYWTFQNQLPSWTYSDVGKTYGAALVSGGIAEDGIPLTFDVSGVCNPTCSGSKGTTLLASLHAQKWTQQLAPAQGPPSWTTVDMVPFDPIDLGDGTLLTPGVLDAESLVLPNKTVLVVGGRRSHQGNSGVGFLPFTNLAQIFEPVTNQWRVAGCPTPGVLCENPSRLPAVTSCPPPQLPDGSFGPPQVPCEDGDPSAEHRPAFIGGRFMFDTLEVKGLSGMPSRYLIFGGGYRIPQCADGSICALNADKTDYRCQNGTGEVSCQDCPANEGQCVNHVCSISGRACGPVRGQQAGLRRSILEFDPVTETFSVVGFMNVGRGLPKVTVDDVTYGPPGLGGAYDHRLRIQAGIGRLLGGLLPLGEPTIEYLNYSAQSPGSGPGTVTPFQFAGVFPGSKFTLVGGQNICLPPVISEKLLQTYPTMIPGWVMMGGPRSSPGPGPAWTGTLVFDNSQTVFACQP